ncbi:hypothetical protein IV203_014031 [Nitzschia inconspicua]|uniref:Uncharacterized protein n=1 Tax=Nitzschia inconspicua TaxID=303405 RepID=A0A9K3Q8I6_9STRA|nr:hypothetical protein IV203_014031 [Nitzschia inconspicua]
MYQLQGAISVFIRDDNRKKFTLFSGTMNTRKKQQHSPSRTKIRYIFMVSCGLALLQSFERRDMLQYVCSNSASDTGGSKPMRQSLYLANGNSNYLTTVLEIGKPSSRPTKPLPVITLYYNPHVNGNKKDRLVIKRRLTPEYMLHNCLLVQQQQIKSGAEGGKTAPFEYVVVTDDLSLEVCQHCECRKFEPYSCPCPTNDCVNERNVCEKTFLFSDLLVQEEEFIFVDFDLLLLSISVLEELQLRSRTTDFLATRAHASLREKPLYRNDFNSGLVYIRNVPQADPTLLQTYLYDNVTNSFRDQSVLSYFVHHHYKRWDELSFKWHCRGLREPSQLGGRSDDNTKTGRIYPDMNIHDCQVFHPPQNWALDALNFTFLKP